MKIKTPLKELEHESTRLAACLCAAIDAVKQAEAYATRKDSALRFTSDNISSIALSIYIRKRDEAKPAWQRRTDTTLKPEGAGGGSNL